MRTILGGFLAVAMLAAGCGDDTQSPVVAEHNGYYQRVITRLDDGGANACVLDGDGALVSTAVLLPDGPEGGTDRVTTASGRFADGVRTWSMACEWSDDGSTGDCLFVLLADGCVGQYRYVYTRI